LVKNIQVTHYGPTAPFTAAFGKLFFPATDSVHGTALWESDGTTQGTVLFKALNTNPNSMAAPVICNASSGVIATP
jgi:ELWxxDGT repeat protein